MSSTGRAPDGGTASRTTAPRALKRQRRWRGPPVWVLVLVLTVATAAGALMGLVYWAHGRFNGEWLGQRLGEAVSGEIQGRLTVRRIRWELRALGDLLIGTATPLALDGVRIDDPQGRDMIHASRVDLRLRLWPLITAGQLVVDQVTVYGGYCVVAEMPEWHNEEENIGIAEAFEGVGPSSGKPGRGAPLVWLKHIVVRNARFRLEVAKTTLDVRDIDVTASLRLQGHVQHDGLFIDASPVHIGRGYWAQHGVVIPLSGLGAASVTIDGHNIIVPHISGQIAGSPGEVEGVLQQFLVHERSLRAHLTLDGGARFFAGLAGLRASGRGLLDVRIRGPLAEPRPTVEARVSGLDLVYSGLELHDLGARALVDPAAGRASLTDLSVGLLSGTVTGHAGLDLESGAWQGVLKTSGIDPGSFVPLLAGKVDGSLALSGEVGTALSATARFDIGLKRRLHDRHDPLPTQLAVRGRAHLSPQIIDLAGLTVSAGEDALRLRGSFDPRRKAVNMLVTFDISKAGEWLARSLGFRWLRSLSGEVRVHGTYPQLAAKGHVAAREVGAAGRRLPELRAEVELQRGVLALRRIHGEGGGARVNGDATLELFRGDLRRPVSPPVLALRLDAHRLDLEGLGGLDTLHGRLDGRFSVRGPLDALEGSAEIEVADGVIAGRRFDTARARLGLLPDRLTVYDARIAPHDGGEFRFWGDLLFNRQLAMRLQARALHLRALPYTDNLPLDCTFNGRVYLQQQWLRPSVTGALQLDDVVFNGSRFGSLRLELEPSEGGVRAAVTLGGGQASGVVTLRYPPDWALEGKLDLRKFPLHKFAPQLAKYGDVASSATGQIDIAADQHHGLRAASVQLSALEASLAYRPFGERRPRRIRLANREPVRLVYADGNVHVQSFRVASSVVDPGSWRPEADASLAAELNVSGSWSRDASELALNGKVPLALAELFLARRVRRVAGVLDLAVRLRGSVAEPNLRGTLDLRGVRVRLPRFDQALEVPVARLVLGDGKLELQELRFRYGFEELTATGHLLLAPDFPFLPKTVAVVAQGAVNARLLQLVAAEEIASASGGAKVQIAVDGPVSDPRLSGWIDVNQIELAPRGLGHTIALQRGKLAFSDYLVCLGGALACPQGAKRCDITERSCTWNAPITGSYDEGSISLVGEARLDRRRLADLYVRLRGTSLPQRDPDVYTAELNTDLTLVGDDQSLALSGTVDVVDARYIREFDIVKDAVIRPRTHEERPPPWDGVPLLERLALNLDVRTTGQIRVKNGYADLGIDAALDVGGTLGNPRIGGIVRVEEGLFRIPFLRGEYSVQRGEMAFSRSRPADEAEVNILTETHYVDRNGTDYLINLLLQGPLNNIRIKLTSQPTLDQGQILALLATGQTTEQWRARLAEQRGGGQAVGLADQQVKELTGQFLGQFFEDPLKNAIGLDLVRLEIGTESVGARGCKNVGTAIEVCGEGERDFLGGFAGKATARYKMHDWLRLIGRVERLSTRLDREIENPSRGRIELRLRVPVR